MRVVGKLGSLDVPAHHGRKEEGSAISRRHRKQSVRQTRLFIYTQIHRGEEEAFASA